MVRGDRSRTSIKRLITDSSECNMRYFPENQNHAPPLGWAASMAAHVREEGMVIDSSLSQEGPARVLPWLHEQYTAMASPDQDESDGYSTDKDRQREMREVESFKTIHINEMKGKDE